MKFTGRNIQISPSAHIGNNVRIGDDTIIYDNVHICDNTTICNHCVIGEPTNAYYSDPNYRNPPTYIGADSLIRSHTIIYADTVIGDHFSTGHRVTIREQSKIGSHCRIGTLCDIQGLCTLGDYNWLHSNIFVAHESHLGDFVFIYPCVMLANDPHPPSEEIAGVTIHDFAQIGAHSTLLAGVEIGRHALVASGSMVIRAVADYQLAGGNPARIIKDVREIRDRTTGKSHYPWPLHFTRGMPWAEVGFETWIKSNQQYEDTLS